MEAVEFLKETERMCKSNEECIKCDGRNCCVKRRAVLIISIAGMVVIN